jgi:hypothetical protein
MEVRGDLKTTTYLPVGILVPVRGPVQKKSLLASPSGSAPGGTSL